MTIPAEWGVWDVALIVNRDPNTVRWHISKGHTTPEKVATSNRNFKYVFSPKDIQELRNHLRIENET